MEKRTTQDKRRRLRWQPLWVAVVVSLLFHLVAILGIRSLETWVQTSPKTAPQWAKAIVAAVDPKLVPDPDALKKPVPEPEWKEMDLSFIEVNPAMASAEAPKQTPFYSTENTLQASPDPQKEKQAAPKIDGKQKVVQKTFDTKHAAEPQPASTPQPPPKPEPEPKHEVAQVDKPAPEEKAAQKEKSPQPAQAAKPEGGLKAGETELAAAKPEAIVPNVQPAQKAQPEQKEEVAQEPVQRRKPIARVSKARELKGVIEGERMEQKGGSHRFGVEPTFDVRQSPFGRYDQSMIAAVQARWYALLDGNYAFERSGKVTVRFLLHSDGTVSDLQNVEQTVGESLSFKCEAAVLGAAAFDRWPTDMRSAIGKDTREVTFTFYYSTD